MILKVNGNIKEYYVQMLLLLFFPGSTFSKNEVKNDSIPEVFVSTVDTETYVESFCSINYKNREYSSSLKELYSEYLPVFSREQIIQFIVGKLIYNICTLNFDITPPWGIMTGVRPAKIVSDLYSCGYDETVIRDVLKNTYLLKDNKIELAIKVSKNERKIIDKIDGSECGLFVSIPFCPSKCAYCSFTSYASKKLISLIPEYLKILANDIIFTLKNVSKFSKKITSIYIGGGTPTILSENELEYLLNTISNNVDLALVKEFTIEAGRPDTFTIGKLNVLKKYGVNRISVNPQTLNDDVLKIIGRNHSSKDFFDAYSMAKDVGFEIINIDLIAGLPGDNLDSFKDSLDKIVALNPENITVHTFSVKKSSIFKETSNIYFDPANVLANDSVDYSNKVLTINGFIPYYMYRQKNIVGNLENVGYSRIDKESIYNIIMMEETNSVFAVGANSITKIIHNGEILRFSEPKYPYEYISIHADGNHVDKDKFLLLCESQNNGLK